MVKLFKISLYNIEINISPFIIIGNTMGEWPTNTDSQDKGSIPDSDQGFGEEENKNNSDNANGKI